MARAITPKTKRGIDTTIWLNAPPRSNVGTDWVGDRFDARAG